MFRKASEHGFEPALPGVERQTLVHGEKTLMTVFRLRRSAVLPQHSHAHEQTGYLVTGCIRLRIGSEVFEAHAGDSWCIPGDVLHGADALEDSVALEVFSPVREDYRPAAELASNREGSDPSASRGSTQRSV